MFFDEFYSPYQDYRARLDHLFSALAQGFRCEGNFNGFRFEDMSLRLWGDEKKVYCEVELPGVKSEEVDLSIVNNELMLRVTRPSPYEKTQDEQFLCRERLFGTINRQISIPSEVDAKQIDASLENGILHVELHKTGASVPQKIAVSAGA
jgi:HSP20 family protein